MIYKVYTYGHKQYAKIFLNEEKDAFRYLLSQKITKIYFT